MVDAEWVVGKLYGNILKRDADKDGFEFYYQRVVNGYPVKKIVEEFLCCDEFIEKFILNDTPNEVAKKLLISLHGRESASPASVKAVAWFIANTGFRSTAAKLCLDPAYDDNHGMYDVPNYVQ